MLNSNLLIVFFGTLASSSPALTKCQDITANALQTCKSESVVAGAREKTQAINAAFRPANGRMSPESCQGFRDHYSEFKKLTQNYIDTCKQLIAQAKQQCSQETSSAVRSGPEELDTFIQSVRNLKQAEKDLPKLEALIPPIDNLNGRLDDCLRDLQGQRITNTNKDRGNADVAVYSPTAQKVSVHRLRDNPWEHGSSDLEEFLASHRQHRGQNSEPGGNQVQRLSHDTSLTSRKPQTAGRIGLPRESFPLSSARTSAQHDPTNPLPTSRLGRFVLEGNHTDAARTRTGLRNTVRIANSHSNLFMLIKRRYASERWTLLGY